MSFGVKEARIHQERKPRINLCGDCGAAVSETELLCAGCREPIMPLTTLRQGEVKAAWALRHPRNA